MEKVKHHGKVHGRGKQLRDDLPSSNSSFSSEDEESFLNLNMVSVKPKLIKLQVESKEGKKKKVDLRDCHRRGKKLPEKFIEEKMQMLTVKSKVNGCTGCTCRFMSESEEIEDLFHDDADAREKHATH